MKTNKMKCYYCKEEGRKNINLAISNHKIYDGKVLYVCLEHQKLVKKAKRILDHENKTK
jgi:hypothetical protein